MRPLRSARVTEGKTAAAARSLWMAGGVDPGDAGAVPLRPGVAGDAGLEVARLAHVEHPAVGIEHPVHAGRAVERAQIPLDDLMTGFHDSERPSRFSDLLQK